MKFFLEDEGLIASTSELTLSGSSSSIQDWVSISQDSPEICVINRAFSEAHISDLPNLCPPLCFQYQPARTILDSGANDLKYNNHASQIFEEVELLYFCQISSGAPQNISTSPLLQALTQKRVYIARLPNSACQN